MFQNLLQNKKILIACHRGSHGGNIIQNTSNACLCAYAQGADIAEIDVVRSLDGKYYVYHDSEEGQNLGFTTNLKNLTAAQIDRLRLINKYGCLTTQKIPTFSEVLQTVKGKGLINIDRCWGKDFSYTKGALDLVREEKMTDSIIFKSTAREDILQGLADYPDIPFMGLVYSLDDIEKIEAHKINIVGYEMIFKHDCDILLSALPSLRQKGYLLWVNTITLDDTTILSGGHDDARALLDDMDNHWGKLMELGFNVLQTDFPQALSNYRNKKFQLPNRLEVSS